MKGQQTKHTPGPWEINEVITESGKPVTQICTRATGVSRWHIATVMRQGADTEGNARLIAAAPELLNACKSILDCDTPTQDMGGHWGSTEWFEWVGQAIEQARTAVAKATQP